MFFSILEEKQLKIGPKLLFCLMVKSIEYSPIKSTLFLIGTAFPLRFRLVGLAEKCLSGSFMLKAVELIEVKAVIMVKIK
jgi:hypothetical protein